MNITCGRAVALIFLFSVLCAVVCATSSHASSSLYVQSRFGSRSCLNGDTGSIKFTHPRWDIVAGRKYTRDAARKNVYCMNGSKTLQFINGRAAAVESLSFGIRRYLPRLPPGLMFTKLAIVNVSRVDARKHAGCALNSEQDPAGLVIEAGVHFTSGDRRTVHMVYMPLVEFITEKPDSFEVDVRRSLYIADAIKDAAVAYVAIWNHDFPAACTMADPTAAGMRVFSDIVQFEALAIVAEYADV